MLDWKLFREAIIATWKAIDQKVIDNFILSVPRRIAAVEKAKSWYTNTDLHSNYA